MNRPCPIFSGDLDSSSVGDVADTGDPKVVLSTYSRNFVSCRSSLGSQKYPCSHEKQYP